MLCIERRWRNCLEGTCKAIAMLVFLLMSGFSDFFMETKNKTQQSIYHAEFSKYAKFGKNPLQILKNIGCRAHFCKEMHARGQRLSPGIHYFVKLVTLESHIFMTLQGILMQL